MRAAQSAGLRLPHFPTMRAGFVGAAASAVTTLVFLLASPPTSALSISSSKMAAPSIQNSIGGPALRQAVLEASAADVSSAATSSLDVNGILWMEHINLVVSSRPIAEKFYMDFLGFTKDKSPSFHVNLGQQQLHLAENGDPAQVVTGSIGLAVPSLSTIRERMEEANTSFEGTKYSVLEDAEDCITMFCPDGNTLHLYGVDDDKTDGGLTSPQKMTNMHSEGSVYGPRMAVRGQPGIRFVEIACRSGTAGRIAKFYEQMLECDVHDGDGRCIVTVGPGVHLVYTESSELTDDTIRAMKGVHICIYANNFKKLYDRLKEKDLIWTNPRFTRLDSCDTWEEAFASRTLRFKDIVDLETGEKLMELEHETRPLRHGQYLKVPYYEPR